MDHLRASGVVVSDGVVFSRYGERIDVEGRVTTASGGVLDVRKVLLAEGDPDAPDPRVRAVSYRYMALWQPSPGVSRPLFRYDEYDGDLATLHRHASARTGRRPHAMPCATTGCRTCTRSSSKPRRWRPAGPPPRNSRPARGSAPPPRFR